MGPERAWVWLARIRKSQGRKGEVFAELLTDFPDKFNERKRVWLLSAAEADGGVAPEAEASLGRAVEIASFFLHKGGVVLRLAGVESIAEADALRGLVVAVPLEQRAKLGEDEVYAGDLIGCLLMDVGPEPARRVGRITDVDRDAGPVALLVVEGDDGEEILVPFARAYLRRVDVAQGMVEMTLPEGLVEVQMGG